MNIRNRLSLQFTLIMASILVLFSGSVYFFSAYYRQQEFYGRLKEKALTTGKLFIEVREVDSALLKIIDRNALNILPKEQVVIYYSDNREAYKSNDDERRKVSAEELNQILQEGEFRFTEDNFEYEGISYRNGNKNYVVVASAVDMYGLSKLHYLRVVLLLGLLFSVILTLIAGWILSGQALKPISQVVREVETITGFNLNKRVGEGNRKDEIAKLSITFNQMLDRIENAFQIQRSFIANASHELRTPLTSITGQLEVASLKTRDVDEYETILSSVLEDIRALNKLTNGLLNIAQTDMDINAVHLKPFRVDEILWEVRHELSRRNAAYDIVLHFPHLSDNENDLCIVGIEPLFKTAISNLVDNACKYSPNHRVDVTLLNSEDLLEIIFKDEGIGIPFSESQKIFEPFYRASNVQKYPGQGLGLSLTRRTVEMHHGQITILSTPHKGTTIHLSFPLYRNV